MQGGGGLWGQLHVLCTLVPLILSRISSISKVFPVLMLYRLWEEGTVASLDDPLERYASSFTINNPLGLASAPAQSLLDRLEEVGPAPRPSPVTLRRMASQLSGEQLRTFPAQPKPFQVRALSSRFSSSLAIPPIPRARPEKWKHLNIHKWGTGQMN